MNVHRGDVVLIDYPYTTGGSKVRPALVVQNELDNARLVNTVIVQITSTTQRAIVERTQLLIDVSTAEGKQSGLKFSSVVNCVNLYTIHQNDVLRKLGSLPPNTLRQIDECLKAALAIS